MQTDSQLKILQEKLKSFKPNEKGTYPPGYYALENKIKNLKKVHAVSSKRKAWGNFLSR